MPALTPPLQHAVHVLAGLAHETRLEIFRTLVAKGGLPAGNLAELLGIAPSTLSFHLKDLRHAGLVTSAKKGRQVIYAVNFTTFNEVLGYLVDDCCRGRPELCVKPVSIKPHGLDLR